MPMEKHLKITGTSPNSWKDAINQTILDASKTIDYITSVTVLEQKAKINDSKIIEYYATLDLTFTIDNDRRSWIHEANWNQERLPKICWPKVS